MPWTVQSTGKVRKQIRLLPDDIKSAYFLLAQELEKDGPHRTNWAHFGKFGGSKNLYHCHIARGRPTYVACWEVKDKSIRLLEVYYVGTHENAPY